MEEFEALKLDLEGLELLKNTTDNRIIKRLITYIIRGKKATQADTAKTQKNLKQINNTINKLLDGKNLSIEEWEHITNILKSLKEFLPQEDYFKHQEKAFKLSKQQDNRGTIRK